MTTNRSGKKASLSAGASTKVAASGGVAAQLATASPAWRASVRNLGEIVSPRAFHSFNLRFSFLLGSRYLEFPAGRLAANYRQQQLALIAVAFSSPSRRRTWSALCNSTSPPFNRLHSRNSLGSTTILSKGIAPKACPFGATNDHSQMGTPDRWPTIVSSRPCASTRWRLCVKTKTPPSYAFKCSRRPPAARCAIRASGRPRRAAKSRLSSSAIGGHDLPEIVREHSRRRRQVTGDIAHGFGDVADCLLPNVAIE
jgi:hypothetical protein